MSAAAWAVLAYLAVGLVVAVRWINRAPFTTPEEMRVEALSRGYGWPFLAAIRVAQWARRRRRDGGTRGGRA